MAGTDHPTLVALVTVDGETMTVKADEIHHDVYALNEQPHAGQQIDATIRIADMHASEFAALPE